jgi:predicted phosphodiesterase
VGRVGIRPRVLWMLLSSPAMRILIYSDLHLEFPAALEHFSVPPDLEFDTVILAGDIHAHSHGIDWAAATFAGKPVIYVAGNHEFYGAHIYGLVLEMRKAAEQCGVHFLEQDAVVLNGVRFLGTTLWTDFALMGAGLASVAMHTAARCMPDFRVIRIGASHGQAVKADKFETWNAGILQPADTVLLFKRSREWLAGKLAEPFNGTTVVVTHHLPSARSVAQRFEQDPVSAAFASNLDHLVQQADLWVHGHTHDSFDYTINKSRVVCNPRGYPDTIAASENHAFRHCIVEI